MIDNLPPQSLYSQSGRSNMTLLLVVLGLVVLGGGGFVAYQMFFSGSSVPSAPPMPMSPPPGMPPGATPPGMPGAPPPGMPGVDGAVPLPPPGMMPGAPPMLPGAPSAAPPAEVPAAPSPEAAAVPPAADPAAVPAETSLVTPVTDAGAAPGDTVPAQTTTTTVEAKPADPVTGTPAETTTTVTTTSTPQLQPIDPTQVVEKAGGEKPVASPEQANAIKTINEVNEILGATGVAPPTVEASLAKQVEVTPRAQEVITVKKTYSAKSTQAVNAAGDRVLRAGQYGAAVDIYTQQLKNNPSDPAALAGKAIALQRLNRDAEAMETYERLLDLNPRDLEALTNYLGLLQKQDPEQALTRLQALSEQYPGNAAIAGQKGMIYARMMDTPNALRAFQDAAALDPTNPTYPFNLGVLYDRLGTSDKAIDAYHAALLLARNYPEKTNTQTVDAIRQRLRAIN